MGLLDDQQQTQKLMDRNSDEPRATSWRKCLLALLFTVGITVATFAADVRAENPHAMGFGHRSKAKPKAPLMTTAPPKALSIARDRRDPPANGTGSPPPEATSMTAGRGGVHHVLHSWHVCSSTWPVGTKTRGKITIEDLVLSAWKRDLRPRTLAPVWKSNLQPDFNVRVIDGFDARLSAVLRELDESNRSVQKSAESTSI